MDLAAAVARLATGGGPALALVGRLPGGETGAYELRDDRGRRLVAKLVTAAWMPWLGGLETRTERLRARGYPVARHAVHHLDEDVVLVVQDHVEGAVSDDVPDALLDRLAALNELQAGLGDEGGGPWGVTLRRTLTEGADGYCLHEPLRGHSSRTRRLLDRVQAVGADLVPATLPDGDVLHADFHHRNVLRRDGGIAAVIDWEGSRGGDRVFDLVTLAFTLPAARASAAAGARLWRLAEDAAPGPRLEAYVAHLALRQVDWSIRHHGPAAVELWLDAGERALARYG